MVWSLFKFCKFLNKFIWIRLSMFKYDTYITNSLIITKDINKAYRHTINVCFWQRGFKKGDNWNANRTHPFICSWSAIIGPNFSSRRIMIGNHRNKTTESWLVSTTMARTANLHTICRFLVVGNIFRLETCMSSLVKVPPYSKWPFQGKFFVHPKLV